ncbi:transferase [Burkholderia ubonensis]|nr:transferase [Burkholderia ubonensis]
MGLPSGDALIEIHTCISADSEVGSGVWLRAGSAVTETKIGKSCFVGFRSILAFADIGEGSMFASRVNLQGARGKRIRIGRNVWLGTSVTVAAGVTIGDGAVVAAGALVTADVGADEIAVGRPARIVSKRQTAEDGFPDPSPILNRVRQRAAQGLPTFLDESSLSSARPIAEGGLVNWRVSGSTFVDAELAGGEGVSIDEGCILIGRSAQKGGISPRGGIHLGSRTRVASSVIVEGAGGLVVGEDSEIGSGVTIVTSTHDHRFRSLPWVEAPVTIGPRCVIGEGSVIVGPVNIGEGATVEPYSVVIRDVQAGHLSRGVVSIQETKK